MQPLWEGRQRQVHVEETHRVTFQLQAHLPLLCEGVEVQARFTVPHIV